MGTEAQNKIETTPPRPKPAKPANAKTTEGASASDIEAAQEAAREQVEARHKREREDLKKSQELEVEQLDPTARPVDRDAYDATAPRGPEAPMETLKPSQRQGQGIEPPPISKQAGPPILEQPHDPSSEKPGTVA